MKEQILRVAWYKAKQWDDLLEASVDRDELEDTYFEWVQNWIKHEAMFAEQGLRMVKVEVDVPELVAWCKKRGIPLDGEARGAFVAMKAP